MKDEIITIRFTQQEKEQIDSLAREFGMTRSSFIRLLLKMSLKNIEKLKEMITLEQARALLQE